MSGKVDDGVYEYVSRWVVRRGSYVSGSWLSEWITRIMC